MIQIIVQRGGFVYPSQPVQVPTISGVFKSYKEILTLLPESEHTNLYYTLGHHSGIEGATHPQRTAATFAYQTVLAWDIDTADTTKPLDYAAVLARVIDCPTDTVTVITSGNGVHLLVNLKHPIRQADYFKKNKAAYTEVCFKMGQLLVEAGLPGKVDTAIFEPARVLRVPGTVNRKPNKPDTKCELVQLSEAVLDIDLFKMSGLQEVKEENVSPREIRQRYPHPDFDAMYHGCIFMQWAVNNPHEVHEPHAFDLFSLLATVQPASKVTIDGVAMDAQTLARKVFEGASSSPSLARTTFEDKWAQSSRYGCRTCETIDTRWSRCSECPNFAKIPTPLALKGPEHIGSDATGYWVLNAKGNPLHPHYADLTKLFVQKNSYITGGGERLLVFENTHYSPIEPLQVKGWVDRTVTPNDAVREMHRNEFLARVKVAGSVSPEAEERLLHQSILGKLNCANGVLDIVTGEFFPHSPTFGFQYVLPYAYTPNLKSELFDHWLDVMTKSRVELKESLLDIMAYCLWPNYDDHLIAYLIGEGSNGKSTFINVLRALIGKENYAAASIQQLTKNRFYPAELEGKLANISEESSGNDMDAEQVNVLKNLASGGQMMAERKNRQGYLFRNKAKMVFSANKVPKFNESTEALKRRLVVIPFDYKIVDKDSNVEAALIREVPSILSELVRRIQVNIRANEGKFIVSRNSATHAQAQKDFLTAYNYALIWAQEALKISALEDDYVPVNECYAQFRNWAEENGIHNCANKINFGKTLTSLFFPKDTMSDVKWVAGKTVRVYRGVKFREMEGMQDERI